MVGSDKTANAVQRRFFLPMVIVAAAASTTAFQVAEAATVRLPGNCSSISSCVSGLATGDTLLISDGSYSDSIGSIKGGVIVAAENDGKVIFTGNFNPGNNGFEMRGIVVKSGNQKTLGSGNTYRRMSFVGGPSCGNTVNALIGSNTKIYESAFYGRGGRYLALAYEVSNVLMENVILRPDGGWGQGSSSCTGSEPHAAYNMYDSEGITIKGAIVVDAISEANSSSENIGGQVINTHSSHSNVGTISQSVITASGNYGRFSSDGNGSHSVSIVDSVSKGNTMAWGLSRNCSGTTTATRFDSDKKMEAFKGSLNRTPGANLQLNYTFLNDARWTREMCADAGVTRGFCGSGRGLGDYVAGKIGAGPAGPTPSPPTDVRTN